MITGFLNLGATDVGTLNKNKSHLGRESLNGLPILDWSMAMSMKNCLDCWLIWEGPGHYGQWDSGEGGYELWRKLSELKPSSMLSASVIAWVPAVTSVCGEL